MAVQNMFTKAVKRQAKLRLDVNGPSGSGKTYTALAVGAELAAKEGKRMAVIDTEHGSASKYSNIFDFDTIDLAAPFDPKRYIEYIQMAQEAGYGVVVIDSLTHAWAGSGGVLEMVEQIAKEKAAKFKSAPDTYAAWNEGKKIQAKFVEAMLASDVHLIVTMRSKQEYERQVDGGKTKIVKLGMAPIQAENMDYEFDVVLDMDESHQGFVSKGRCPDVDGKIYPKPGKEFAEALMGWLDGAEPLAKKPAIEKSKPTVTEKFTLPLGDSRTVADIKEEFSSANAKGGDEASAEDRAAAYAAVKELVGKDNAKALLLGVIGVETFSGMTTDVAQAFIAWPSRPFSKVEANSVLKAAA